MRTGPNFSWLVTCNRWDYAMHPKQRGCLLQKRVTAFRGFAKLKKIQKKTWIELTPPSHPHPNFLFGNPSLTWTEHSNHNNQQLLAMYKQNTWYIQNISTGLGLFLEDFPKKKFRVRPGAKILNVFRAWIGAQLTICAQKWRLARYVWRLFWVEFCVFLYNLGPWTHPPTHFHSNLGFLGFFFFAKPLSFACIFLPYWGLRQGGLW